MNILYKKRNNGTALGIESCMFLEENPKKKKNLIRKQLICSRKKRVIEKNEAKRYIQFYRCVKCGIRR